MKENLFLSVEWSPVKDPASRFSVRKIVPPPKKKKKKKKWKKKSRKKEGSVSGPTSTSFLS